MYVTLQRQRLLRMRAGFVQQFDDATALIAELRDDSQDMAPACQWLVDSRKAVERIDALLCGLDEKRAVGRGEASGDRFPSAPVP